VFSTIAYKLAEIIRIVISTNIDSILFTEPRQDFITPLMVLYPNILIIHLGIPIFSGPFINEMETKSHHDFGMHWQIVISFRNFQSSKIAISSQK